MLPKEEYEAYIKEINGTQRNDIQLNLQNPLSVNRNINSVRIEHIKGKGRVNKVVTEFNKQDNGFYILRTGRPEGAGHFSVLQKNGPNDYLVIDPMAGDDNKNMRVGMYSPHRKDDNVFSDKINNNIMLTPITVQNGALEEMKKVVLTGKEFE